MFSLSSLSSVVPGLFKSGATTLMSLVLLIFPVSLQVKMNFIRLNHFTGIPSKSLEDCVLLMERWKVCH